MKEEIKNVDLSFCCKKEWETLTPIDGRRRFCDSCQHHVVDFTRATRQELDEELKNKKQVCGRFSAAQMSDSFLKIAAATVVATTLTTACDTEVKPERHEAIITESSLPPTAEVKMHEVVGLIFIPQDTVASPQDSLSTDSLDTKQ